MPSLPTVAFSHATGFCGGVWDPVIEELGGEVIVWDHLGHGRSAPLPEPIDWWSFGHDTLRKVAGVEGSVIGVGHSMGGAALVMAELLRPDTFEFLLLIEPVIYPGQVEAIDSPFSERARRRKARFPSREAARENFSSKPPFATWDPRALAGYLRDGLVEDSEGVELACSPRTEAEIYRSAFAHGVWDRLGELTCPCLIIAGELSDRPNSLAVSQAELIEKAGIEIVAAATHFLPMEMPALLAQRIARVRARNV